jgi:hypothetical protein
MPIHRHLNGVVNVNFAGSAHISADLHLAVQEPVLANQFDADSGSWNNGNVPVK